MCNMYESIPDPTVAEYIEAKAKLAEYSLDGGLCFHDDSLVGRDRKSIVKKMKEMEEEIEHWTKIGEKEEVRVTIWQFVKLSRKL